MLKPGLRRPTQRNPRRASQTCQQPSGAPASRRPGHPTGDAGRLGPASRAPGRRLSPKKKDLRPFRMDRPEIFPRTRSPTRPRLPPVGTLAVPLLGPRLCPFRDRSEPGAIRLGATRRRRRRFSSGRKEQRAGQTPTAAIVTGAKARPRNDFRPTTGGESRARRRGSVYTRCARCGSILPGRASSSRTEAEDRRTETEHRDRGRRLRTETEDRDRDQRQRSEIRDRTSESDPTVAKTQVLAGVSPSKSRLFRAVVSSRQIPP